MSDVLVPDVADLSRMLATAGAFAVPVHDVRLTPDELDPAQIVAGDPVTSSLELSDGRGIWEITPGVVTDVESDEIFVVLSGRATIAVEGGATIEVGPGDVCLLAEGAKTTWIVHETLRKVYQTRAGAA
ncbi:putative cupin superfamily protein [Nonomuraea thailandensis]|uniref:Cupin superfamily protein n=1 Tax=Nonomuraea thailandensis TaxID=1188745 RepID=A0A9X2GLN9_9ACTN|nr:cupin domain-containing protein [Nonomuraea thailandensis]MCP2361101.1 putative cupin superfamily protein [Nonomuraea thailandensis]